MKSIWIRLPAWFRWTLFVLAGVVLLAIVLAGAGWWYFDPVVDRTDGVVYGQRRGQDLTMDVLRPKRPNGAAVAVMVSGGWRSQQPGKVPLWLMAPLVRRGFTVFAICHISQPDSTVMEIIEDMNRGVRFVRHHAEDYGIDPQRIGVTGGSAGGHLSLMLATNGGPGSPDAADPIDRQSSEVQAVAVFFPVTDLLNLGSSTENGGDGGPPISFVEAFGPDAKDLETWKRIGRTCSPIYHITDRLPPILIHHGDADTLTPLEQSEWFCERAAEQGHKVTLRVHAGGEHGWWSMPWDLYQFANWFDKHLNTR